MLLPLFWCGTLWAQSSEPAPKSAPKNYDQRIDVPARNIIIELNRVEGATKYHVEVKAIDKVWANPYVFEVGGEDPRLRMRLTPGRYQVRTRSHDDEGFRGPWSSWHPFRITYAPPETMYPADGASIKPKSGINEQLAFEWPEASGAYAYRFVMRNEAGEVLKDYITKDTWVYEELELATEYSWAVQPLTRAEAKDKSRPELGDETKFSSFRVQGAEPGTRDVKIFATKAPRAIKYQFEFLKLDRAGERGSASIYESKVNEFPLTLAPGAYEIRVRTYFEDKSVSDWSPPWAFLVPYEKVKQLAPKDGTELDPRDESHPVHLTWSPQVDVHHYTVYFYDEKGKFVQEQSSEEPKMIAKLPHDRRYRWLVIPYPSAQREMRPPEMPEDAPGFSIGHYIPLKLSVSEEPSYLYSWGRYYTSMIDYQGKNYDNNSLVDQPIYGGTGELAFGYWHRKTRLGVLVHGSMSGMLLDGNVRNWYGAGAHLGYRHISSGGARFRAWLGVNYMQFPEVLSDPYIKEFEFSKVKNAGPQLQLSYMDQIPGSLKYGWHAFTTIYRSQWDLGTPNGLEQKPRLSYAAGIYGTYLYTETTKWMAGYTYKHEAAQYKSADRTGLDNESLLTGHYLSLSIEYGFGEPYK